MPLQRGNTVLVDTNVVIEAHRTSCWNAIAAAFELHTVEVVVEETQTGHQNREPEETIDWAVLRGGLRHIELIDDEQRGDFAMKHNHFPLDAGERDLWIYAERCPIAWFVASPDNASVRFAHRRNQLDRLISLEEMLGVINHRLPRPLYEQHTAAWLARKRTALSLGLLI